MKNKFELSGNVISEHLNSVSAILTHLDHSVGMVVQALEKTNMLKDSIIIFSTDNGGPAEGFNLNAASNYPLRGVKNTLWEGGVRGAALLFSPMLKKRSRVANQTMHIADWVPTLYHAAGGNVTYGITRFLHIFDKYSQSFRLHFFIAI